MKHFLILLVCHVILARASVIVDKPDGFRTTCELLEKYQYPCELHEVITHDGYVLKHFRVPHGRLNSKITNKQVVLLQHGLMGSSSHWLYQNHSLGYLLADSGYDVWLMNTRGNKYSTEHIKQISSSEYWNFSWSEVGLYDIPSTIDYVTNVTKKSKVFHIGYSQGTTSMYVLLSEKPEYKNKIITHLSFSPVALNKHVSSILFKTMEPFEKMGLLTLLRKYVGDFNFIPEIELIKRLSHTFCQPSMPTRFICNWIAYFLFGYSPNELNSIAVPTMFGQFPVGAAFKQSVHYVQLMISEKFQEYDNGFFMNMKLYGQPNPREYNISNIQVPIYAFYGKNDALAPKIDVEKFLLLLPNLADKFNMGECGHNDFLVSNTVARRTNEKTLEILKQYV